MKILVVDDDIPSLGTLCNMLRTCGHTVDTAPGADLALRLMRTEVYDVIFLDYNMPTHDGVWFMRNAAIPPDCAVILVSGHVDATALSQFRYLGIEVIISKPFTMVAISGCLKDILKAA